MPPADEHALPGCSVLGAPLRKGVQPGTGALGLGDGPAREWTGGPRGELCWTELGSPGTASVWTEGAVVQGFGSWAGFR